MELRVTQKPAILGLDITNAQMSLQQKAADMKLQNARADVKIEISMDRLDIDYTSCDESIGYYKIREFSKKAANDGQQAALQAISKYVADGNLMEDVHTNGFIIPSLALRDAWAGGGEIGMGFKPAPFLNYDPGVLSIDSNEKELKLSVGLGGVTAHAVPGMIKAYLVQEPEFDIEFVGNNLDTFR